MTTTKFIKEQNLEMPATKRQLWALYCITKKDYRGQDLTRADACKLLQTLKCTANAEKSSPRKNNLEKEFVAFMKDKMQGIIATAREALQLRSVIEEDANIFPNRERKRYAFVGFGCGITIIDYDKRSNIGKQIIKLSSDKRNDDFLKMFLKGFSQKELRYFESIGCPLSALYNQDIKINLQYESAVADFMQKHGVKKVLLRTYDD